MASDLRANDESRNRATHHGEEWSADEIDFLMAFWGKDPEVEVAECLGRTIEACRQRHYEVKWGRKPGPSTVVQKSTRTTTTTTTETRYIGLNDSPDDQWWSPAYYTEGK